MRIIVTGASVWTAAGDLEDLAASVSTGQRNFTDTPPYDTDGLKNPRVGQIAELSRDRPAEVLLETVVEQALAEAGPRQGRTGLVVGTSSGNICGPWERWHRAVLDGSEADEAGTGRDGPTRVVAEAFGLAPATTLSVACVSGTAVLTIAEAWLRDGVCDRVVVAGVDALSLYVHAGFSGLGALASSLPRPFEDARDGLLLGEGAAALVLEFGEGGVAVASALSSDAVHMTAPDREGGGATRALSQALKRSGIEPGEVDGVSVHGTGTRFNDAMERVAMRAVFGAPPPIQLVKRSIGHTMGAAGAIEAALVVHTLRAAPGAMASMSSAFGGMNTAAVFSTTALRTPTPRSVRTRHSRVHDGDLARAWPDAPLAAKRGNASVRAALAAIYTLSQLDPLDPSTALVLSTRTGCRPTDLVYHERLVREGAAMISRLQFTYTVPAAPIAEASIRFGLHGPLLAFLSDSEFGVAEAERLVRWGHANAAIALDIEDGEPVRAVWVEADRGS